VVKAHRRHLGPADGRSGGPPLSPVHGQLGSSPAGAGSSACVTSPL
jgi:hypothetical protein